MGMPRMFTCLPPSSAILIGVIGADILPGFTGWQGPTPAPAGGWMDRATTLLLGASKCLQSTTRLLTSAAPREASCTHALPRRADGPRPQRPEGEARWGDYFQRVRPGRPLRAGRLACRAGAVSACAPPVLMIHLIKSSQTAALSHNSACILVQVHFATRSGSTVSWQWLRWYFAPLSWSKF